MASHFSDSPRSSMDRKPGAYSLGYARIRAEQQAAAAMLGGYVETVTGGPADFQRIKRLVIEYGKRGAAIGLSHAVVRDVKGDLYAYARAVCRNRVQEQRLDALYRERYGE
jgi:hypothetical protein